MDKARRAKASENLEHGLGRMPRNYVEPIDTQPPLSLQRRRAVVGDFAGDLILYAAGRWGLPTPCARFSVLVDRRRIAVLRRQFRAHPGKALLFGKLTHGAGFLFLLAAGAARIRPSAFVRYNLLGTLPKSAFFISLGYLTGAAYVSIDSYLGATAAVVFALVCLATFALTRQPHAPEHSAA